MAVKIPFSYSAKRTPLHSLNAGIKLLCLFLFSAAAFFGSPLCSLSLSAALYAASFYAGLNPLTLLRGSRPIVILGLFVALGRALDFAPSFDVNAFLSGLLFLWSMLLSFCAGSLLFAVTTMTELREAACAVEAALLKPLAALLKDSKNPLLSRLRNAALHPRLGLALSLMLGFIPRFFAEWDALLSAHQARAGKMNIAVISRLIPLAVNRMIDTAAETAAALEARGALL
jgi:biotin transport system permease protein